MEDQPGSFPTSPENKTGDKEPGDGIFYGWYIVAAMFFATFIGVGTR